MKFQTKADIEELGFEGFIRIQDFYNNSALWDNVPKEPGNYMILRIADDEPVFLVVNPSAMHSRHKKKPEGHSYDVKLLKTMWEKTKQSIVIYIGKAGGGDSSATVRSRLRQFMNAGKPLAKSSSHAGGRAIWQFSDAKDLLVCWKAAPNPRAVETQLIASFKEQFGERPVANWSD